MEKESIVLPRAVAEVLVSETLKGDDLQESSPSKMHKDDSSGAGLEKPATEEAEVIPSSAPTLTEEKVTADAEVMITGARKGDPPAQNVLAKVIDDKRQVVIQPYASITDKTTIDELYQRSMDLSIK